MSGVTFSPAAVELFQLTGPTAVSAGAGSGKTTALIELVTRLLSGEALGAPCAPGEIVAITFTEKAAEELTERLRAAVATRARAAAGSPDAQAWLDRLSGLDRMAVGTIHGFCGRLLREHAPEAGLDPDFEVADEERASAWLREAARAAVVAALDAGRPAARALAGGLGAAGARGGLTALVAELVRARATRGDPRDVPCAPGSPEAAQAARDRLLALANELAASGGAAQGPGARDLAAAVGRALEGLRGDDRHGSLDAGALERLGALGEVARGRRFVKADGGVKALRDELVAAAEAFVPLAAEALAGDQKAELARLVGDAEARYAAAKRAARAVDFDDLLVRARDLLRADRALRMELRGRIRALLVDEYQDVNGVQQALFDLVAGPAAPGEPAGPVLVGVGDLKQSIYRFRGADVSVFARLIQGFAGGEGRVLHLADNHRSAPGVVELVNEVFARCMVPPEGAPARDDELRFDAADRLVPRRPEGARPACELLVDGGEGNAEARRAREAEAIAARIRALVSGAAGVAVREREAGGSERPRCPRPGDVAILFRRLTQLGPYERALRAAGIPYRLARGGGFYQAAEVRDLGELLATLFDPADAAAWAAVLRSPLCAVSDGALLLLARVGFARLPRLDAKGLKAAVEEVVATATGTATPTPTATSSSSSSSSSSSTAIPSDEWRRLTALLDAWRELRALRDRLPLPELLAAAVDALDLDAALLAGPDGERRAENLRKALAVAARFAAGGGTAPEFAQHLRSMASRPPREPEAGLEAGDAVALLSVHQAKGLEWPIVFVPDLGARPRADGRRALIDAQGRLCAQLFVPEREVFVETASMREARAAERRAAAAESRRLLYVALTRARDALVLSGEASNGAETWRGLVEAAGAERPDLLRRVPVEAAGTFAAGSPIPEGPRPALPAVAPAAPPRLAGPAALAAVRVAVTDLAEYARCPRRHHLGRVLGLREPRGVAGAPAGDDPARATARGTLAHAMLAEADLAAPPLERRAQLASAAARRGYDPASPAVKRILVEVQRFLDSEPGRALALAAREGRLRREVPFLMRLDPIEPGRGAAAYVVGALDALVAPRRGDELTVIDYKYATFRPDAAVRYRVQLLAYALAASRARPGARVRARLQFLRADFRAVDVTLAPKELARFAADAPRLAEQAFLGAGDRPPAELGRDEPRCRAESCGFVPRCYPQRAS